MLASPNPIFILGMHRSGTSLLCQVMAALGVEFGSKDQFAPEQPANPFGYYEHNAAKAVNDELLNWRKCTWYDPFNWANDALTYGQIKAKEEKMGRVIEMIQTGSSPWAIKDPRFCVTLPDWMRFIDCRIIAICRDPREVVYSLQRRDGFSRRYGYALWYQYQIMLLGAVKEEKVLHLDYNALLQNPKQIVAKLAYWIFGEQVADSKMSSSISQVKPEFNRSASRVAFDNIPDEVQSLYLSRYRYSDPDFEPPSELDQNTYDAIQQERTYFLLREFRVQAMHLLHHSMSGKFE